MELPQTKYIAIAASAVLLIAFAAFVTDRFADYRRQRLEKAIAETKANADENQRRADALETNAAAYREKIAYLEKSIADISAIARKQDEEIKLHARRTDAARGDVNRVKSIRAIDATTDELCQKLAELGHGCE